ncbi:MAG: response regulator, partial [Campylobacterota bacterium]
MKKILIIDNSKFITKVIKKRIDSQSLYEVLTARTLQEARDITQYSTVFMIVTNLTLEDASENEILNFLKNSGILSIVFSTSIESQLIHNEDYPNILDYVFKDLNGAIHICNLIDAVSFGKGKKVLVVDDSQASINYIKKTLRRLLLQVESAKNGKEALRKLQDHEDILLVISDMNMPLMNGLDLTKAIRANPKFSKLKIIITTGYADDKTKVELFKYGVDDVLYKPVVAEEMMYKTANVILEEKSFEDIERFNQVADEHIISSSTDENGIITQASEAFSKISGYRKNELIGQSHRLLRHPDMPASVYTELWETIKQGKTWLGEIKNRKKDGGFYWVLAIVKPFVENDGTVAGYYAIRQDITDKKRIEEISITDGLTDIYNRRHFNDTFPQIIESA